MSRRKPVLDSAVSAALGLGKVHEPSQPGSRHKITFELATGLVPLLQQMAADHGISPAGLADVLLADGLHRLATGELEIPGEALRPSRSPRFDWIVAIDVAPVAQAVAAYLDKGRN